MHSGTIFKILKCTLFFVVSCTVLKAVTIILCISLYIRERLRQTVMTEKEWAGKHSSSCPLSKQFLTISLQTKSSQKFNYIFQHS